VLVSELNNEHPRINQFKNQNINILSSRCNEFENRCVIMAIDQELNPMKTFSNPLTRITLLLLVLLAFSACRKEKDDLNLVNSITHSDPAAVYINARLMGVVENEQGQAVSGAVVKVGNHQTTTNAQGLFLFNNVPLNQQGAFVHVTHSGHWQASRKVYPHHNGSHYTRLVILPVQNVAQVDAATGGEVTSNSGFEMNFQPDAFADAAGNPFSGSVSVAARWLNPMDEGTVHMMPGDLRGVNAANQQVAIANFGIAAVELSGGGQDLNLREGYPAELKFPVPEAMQSSAPSEIGLWRFDEVSGIWRQEGTATLNGSYYLAEVAHFSFWSIGEEYDVVELSGTISDENDNPVSGIPVSVLHPDFGYIGTVFTAANGFFSGQVPAGEQLTLMVSNQCNESLIAQSISPLSSDTDLGTITISDGESSMTMISGTLQNCDGEAVNSGIIYVCWSGGCQAILAANDGSFAQSFVHCATQSFNILVIDYNSGQTVSLNKSVSESINLGSVVVCEAQLDTYISLNFDGNLRFYPFPNQFIQNGRTNLKAENSNYSIEVSFPGQNVGVFANDTVSFTYFEYSSTPEIALFLESGSCSLGECSNFTVTVSQYGEIGGYIEGTYSGTLDMSNSLQQFPGESISGNFRVIRQF